MNGLIISSGIIGDYNLLEEHVRDKDYILCADGGIMHAMKIGLTPNAVIGDLDSINQRGIEFVEERDIPIIKFPVEKNETDTELAILFLIKKGILDITLVGVTGNRLDHTIANIYLLKKIKSHGAKGRIIDDSNSIYLIDNYLRLVRKENYYISVIPITFEGIDITLEGFYYPLYKDHVSFGSTLGISNKIINEFGEINIIRGEALIIESKD